MASFYLKFCAWWIVQCDKQLEWHGDCKACTNSAQKVTAAFTSIAVEHIHAMDLAVEDIKETEDIEASIVNLESGRGEGRSKGSIF